LPITKTLKVTYVVRKSYSLPGLMEEIMFVLTRCLVITNIEWTFMDSNRATKTMLMKTWFDARSGFDLLYNF